MVHKGKRYHTALCCVLGATFLAGCSTGAPVGGDGKADPSKETAIAGEKPAPAKPLELKIIAPLYSDPPDMNNKYWKEWERITNSKVTVEWVPTGDYNNKIDLVLSSGNLPEVVTSLSLTAPTLRTAIQNGAFWDLTPFLGDFSKYPNLKNKTHPEAYKYTSVDGKIYGVPRMRSMIDTGVKIRQDWFEKLNIPVPKTTDEYAAALKKIVESDPDGNGKRDTIGIATAGIPRGQFQGAFGMLDPIYDTSGGMIESRLTDENIQFIEWLRKLYSDGILPKEFTAVKDAQSIEMFTSGQAASMTRSVWWDYEWEKAINKTQPGGKILNLPGLKGPKGTAVELGSGVLGGFYISSKVPEQKVKELLAYFERSAADDVFKLSYIGLEGVHHTLEDGQPKLTEQGVKEVNVTSKGLGVLQLDQWGKTISQSAPKAYNDNKKKEVGGFAEIGKVNPFAQTSSDTWTDIWPKYEKEYDSITTKAIVGQISMEEYKNYVTKLRNMPEMKKAFKEFAEGYKKFHSKN